MEIFLLVVILILIVVCLSFLSGNRRTLKELKEDISLLRNKVNQLNQQPVIDPNEKWKRKEAITTGKKPGEIISPEYKSEEAALTKTEISAPEAKDILNIHDQPSPLVTALEKEKSFASKSSSPAKASSNNPEKISWFQKW